MKISNVEVKDLVNTYGSPLYVYDQRMIEDKLNAFKTHLKSSEFECDVIYASKAFNCKAMIQLVSKMDCSLDVPSVVENCIQLIWLALIWVVYIFMAIINRWMN